MTDHTTPTEAEPTEPVQRTEPGQPAEAPVNTDPVTTEAITTEAITTDPVTTEAITTEAVNTARRKGSSAVKAAAAVAAAALLGVGIGVGILKTQYRETTITAGPAPAATPSPSAGPSYGAKSNGTHFGSMRDLLLPTPSGYRLGPDAGAYGNDTELTDDQRTSWVDDEVRGLPSKLQDALRKGWQEMPLRGAGVRTFTSPAEDMTVTIWLLQYNENAVKADNAWADVLGSDSGLFRLGPQVPGHNEAHCYLPAAAPGDRIDELSCSAAEGDLRVVLKVQGIAPLPKDQAVNIFNQQLDRLAIPGATA